MPKEIDCQSFCDLLDKNTLLLNKFEATTYRELHTSLNNKFHLPISKCAPAIWLNFKSSTRIYFNISFKCKCSFSFPLSFSRSAKKTISMNSNAKILLLNKRNASTLTNLHPISMR